MEPTNRYLFRMTVFLGLVLAAGLILAPALVRYFLANPALNGIIFFTLAFGIAYVFRQVLVLRREASYIGSFRHGQVVSLEKEPQLVGPMLRLLSERKGRGSISTLSMRSLLDSISARLDESRDVSRYLVGLLIFLGLLGTFWGLLQTVGTIGTVINGLDLGSRDPAQVFAELKTGLSEPLAGMGTAFSASLFGLAGSLVLGFLDLQQGQAQNRFYNDLEEWLAGFARLSSGGGTVESDQSMPAYIQALLEQTADNLEGLRSTIAQGEDSRLRGTDALVSLNERMAALTDQMRTEQSLMVRLAEGQMAMRPVLEQLVESLRSGIGADDATRTHIRNLDVYMGRLLQEISQGRVQAVQDIRGEIKLLARTIAALAESAEPR
jgi:hypothetical protein